MIHLCPTLLLMMDQRAEKSCAAEVSFSQVSNPSCTSKPILPNIGGHQLAHCTATPPHQSLSYVAIFNWTCCCPLPYRVVIFSSANSSDNLQILRVWLGLLSIRKPALISTQLAPREITKLAACQIELGKFPLLFSAFYSPSV